MLRSISSFMHAVATTPAVSPDDSLVPSGDRRPSLNLSQVGYRIALFEACSAFTHVTACTLAKSPMATFFTRGFGDFVTSITAPIATGWSDSCRVGFAPTEDRRLFTAH